MKNIFFCEKMFQKTQTQNVSGPSNPPDEPAQNVSKKISLDKLFLHFSSKVHNLTVFSIIYMTRIRFFGLGELIQRTFWAAQYLTYLIKSRTEFSYVAALMGKIDGWNDEK